MKSRVVITGLGTVSPLGNDVKTTWNGAIEGKCGIAPISYYDTEGRAVTLAAEVKNFSAEAIFGKKEARKLGRFSQLAVAAAREAFNQSGISMENEDPYRCGILISSGIGGLDIIETEQSKGLKKGFDRISPFFIPTTIVNMAAGMTAIDLGFKGMCSCVVTACAGSTNAIGDGFRQIRDGYMDVMLCGGTESCITPLGIGGFTAMRALSESNDPNRASIPFDKERQGFVMGEGSGMVILEEYEHAKARNAVILGEVVGYGATCDAYHMTAPAPDGSGAACCMEQALADAGISGTEVGYINAHGTSTPLNDKSETLAIKQVFGSHAPKLMVSSTKSMTGHLLGATGAVEAIFTTMALKEGIIPATINHQVPDPECDLDIVPNKAREVKVKYALSNSLGFGGHNATLVFKGYEEV
ncbi:MAG: beta-ketoacyl-ACP synthase II [Bacillota bacterium]|nr:beta-ketoacyl-ACP synthase II [Bacillota bacterium]